MNPPLWTMNVPLTLHSARGLAAGTLLLLLEWSAVEQAYTHFPKRFDRLMETSGDGEM